MPLRKYWKLLLILFASLYLLMHLLIANDYSISWDFHHVFFAGLYHHRHPVTPAMVDNLPFTDPDPRKMVETPFGPLESYIPVASYVTFFENLHILPFDTAYNLPTVIVGVFGVFILFLFMREAFTLPVALISALFLAFYPRYFGDLHTNVKDVPTAVFFTATIWFLWRSVNYRRLIDVVIASLLFAITFNFKVNAISIPAIALLWITFILLTKGKTLLKHPISKEKLKSMLIPGGFFILAPLLAFTIWAVFWKNPINHLVYLFRFFQDNTENIEVIFFGKWFCSAVNVPWYYPYGYLAIVTPLPILVSIVAGFIVLSVKAIKKNPHALLLLLWFFIPLARYLSPKIGVIDGIRHFEEVIFPLMAIGGVGAVTLGQKVWQSTMTKAKKIFVIIAVSAVSVIALIIPIFTYHPYELSYFNELVGGLPGAVGKFDIDYWGVSQKEAVLWLNAHTPADSKIYITMSSDVAGKYLRPDLLKTLNSVGYDQADYVVMLNRQGFFYRYVYSWEYFLRRRPAYVVERNGVPLTWVFDNHLGQFPRGREWWTGTDPCIKRYW